MENVDLADFSSQLQTSERQDDCKSRLRAKSAWRKCFLRVSGVAMNPEARDVAACALSFVAAALLLWRSRSKSCGNGKGFASRPRRVLLVGAGPGHPDLISVRGLRAIQAADVLVFDRLVSPELLAQARPDAVRVNVGKAPLKKRFKQDEINKILVCLGQGTYEGKRIREGALIVRLKGGDPFVFGLGGDEILALHEANIAYEVVPGISSALAVPAGVNIPVTQKGVSTAFTVLSGHVPPGEPGAADWENLPRTNATLVVLMGAKSLPKIASFLLSKGWDPATPSAVIQSGTTIAQKSIRTRLDTLTADASEAGMASPCIIVIGQSCDVLPGLVDTQGSSNDPWGLARAPL